MWKGEETRSFTRTARQRPAVVRHKEKSARTAAHGTPKRQVRLTLEKGHHQPDCLRPKSAVNGSGQPSFYHFVGAAIRIGTARCQCSRDAEIDPEVELGGTLERQVAWFCAAMIDNYRRNKRPLR